MKCTTRAIWKGTLLLLLVLLSTADAQDPSDGDNAGGSDPSKGDNAGGSDPSKVDNAGGSDPSKVDNAGGSDSPKGDNAGESDSPKGDNASGSDPSKGDNAGGSDPSKGDNAGGSDPSKVDNAGESDSPKGDNAGESDSPKGDNAGGSDPSKVDNAGESDSPKGDNAGGSDPSKGDNAGCKYNLDTDLPPGHKQPIYLEKEGEKLRLLKASVLDKQRMIILKAGQELVWACPVSEEKRSSLSGKVAECRGDGKLYAGDEQVKIKTDLVCGWEVASVTADLDKTDNSTRFALGFEVDGVRLDLLTGFKRNTDDRTTFVTYSIDGSQLLEVDLDVYRPPIKDVKLNEIGIKDPKTSLLTVDPKYTEMLRALHSKYAAHIEEIPLPPQNDFIFPTHRSAVNRVGGSFIWDRIGNNGLLLLQENQIREKARKENLVLEVATGLSFDQERDPVPNLIWKLVKSGKQCIVLILFNNPEEMSFEICHSQCLITKWMISGPILPGRYQCCPHAVIKQKPHLFHHLLDADCETLLPAAGSTESEEDN